MNGSQGEIAYIISIHAPPRGATRNEHDDTRTGYFNSRPSARGDADLEALRQKLRISIHAPPRGATSAVMS